MSGWEETKEHVIRPGEELAKRLQKMVGTLEKMVTEKQRQLRALEIYRNRQKHGGGK